MTQSQALALMTSPHSWEGRIVNGKYPLRQLLDGTDAAPVYLTERNGAKAVIKLIAADSPQAAAQSASWKLASRMSHPNLVQVFDSGLWHADDEHDLHFAVMEYCDESLAGVLAQRALTAAETRDMLAPALDALKYLHTQNVVHGRMNPADILASGDQLKLSTDALRRSGEAREIQAATPYDAPEIRSGAISPSSDLWPLGVTLYQALTRRLPVLEKSGTLELTEKLPPPFDEIVNGLVTPDRERRLSIAAVKSLLDRPTPEVVRNSPQLIAAEPKPVAGIRMIRSEPTASAGETRPGKPQSEEKRTASWSIGRRQLAIAIGALALLIAVLVGLHLSDSSPAPTLSPASSQSSTAAVRQPVTTASHVKPLAAESPGSVLRQVLPEMPAKVQRTINGTVKVTVRVSVNADGKVSGATLTSRGPSAYFARHSLEAARQWTFAPPVRTGKPQVSAWTLRFEFRRSGTKTSAQRV